MSSGFGVCDDEVTHAAELGEGGLLLFGVERLAVPAVLVGHERKAVALLRLGDEAGRLFLLSQRLGVGAIDGVEIVAVQLDGVPAEGAGAGGVGGAVPAEVRLAALAETVHVEDADQVVELVVRRLVERLPDGALGHLAVAEHDPDAIGQLVEVLAVQRHADADGQPLAERAGGDIDVGQDVRIGMALQAAAELAQRQQLLVA